LILILKKIAALLFLILTSAFFAGSFAQVSDLNRPDSVLIFVSKINIQGNTKTKSFIILRELTFGVGDTLPRADIPKLQNISRENLLKTPLFNYVTITNEMDGFNRVSFTIRVEERWYLWPTLTLNYADRNFSTWLQTMDPMRINYTMGISKYNFRGRNEILKFKFGIGYSQNFSLYYRNLYLDKQSRHSLGGDLAFSRQNEVIYSTIENKQTGFKIQEKYLTNNRKVVLLYTFRPALVNEHVIWANFSYTGVSDTIIKLNPNYFGNAKNHLSFLSIMYQFIHEKRNSKYYPLTGWYLNVVLSGNGFGLKFSDKLNLYTLNTELTGYRQLSQRFFTASALLGKISSPGEQSYFFQRGLGFRKESIHGYEYYVIDGQHYIALKNLLKFTILPTHIKKLEWIPLKKFNKIHLSIYSNIYFDMAYVRDNYNTYQQNHNDFVNDFLYGFGAGFDFVTYYDKVLRLEYSINKKGERGIFINFLAPL
jgi:outer membrane protein assembly factor BamA